MRFLTIIAVIWAAPAMADTVVAARTLRPSDIIMAADIGVVRQTVAGTYQHPDEVLGQEARVVIYAGRPLRRGDIGAPAMVERNQLVELRYRTGGLEITTEARALGRGGLGERVRVMNQASRTTLTALVAAPGLLIVE
ncbi:flagellar basal body P-ring formation chaperone FlgA [Pseudoprimorskyibacter insulae]|uniref:Flagella basal body P-ring formation protein FlgA n=1 Tax=Pseudoprimorskyibacter insulae TaxID=1695997 RepID=A0A2R8AZ21_9RHOB|nr:flagellar basal body P-ring formation chaperone FlgA [Pseudoprimorskyibacter insulae]SPF81217.1 hypothetical protein PRI8871_03039 [Pseudoprimorskyibacter insulae]